MYSWKTDIWSIGVTYFELLVGHTPFIGKSKKDLVKNLSKGIYQIPANIDLSKEGLKFLYQCLRYNEQERISKEELFRHAYVSENFNINKKIVHNREKQH